MIYALQEIEEPKRIKIGYSRNALKRFRTIAGSLPQKVTLLWIMEGDKLDESFYHQHLAPHRVPGTREWYIPNREMLEFLETKVIQDV